jgi:hypothetical protein
MADVQIQQTPSSNSGGGAGWAWAIVVIILLGVIAWFVFGGGLHKTTTSNTKVEISTPGAGSAPSGGSAPAAPSGGSGGAPPSGATKTP